MEPLSPASVTYISPRAAPNDSFVGPEFAEAYARRSRREKKCSCTACGVQKDSSVEKVFAHPILGVLICEPCHRFYHTGPFTKDDDGFDEQCRWCGQGGNLIMCDFCPNSFCNYCIKRNFSKKVFSNIFEKPKFKCFVCDDSMLKNKKEECQKLVNLSEIAASSRTPMGGQSSVLESLTAGNERLDDIIGPLEKSFSPNRDGPKNYNESNKENHVSGKRVNPITILKNDESYVIQQRSMSCDEGNKKTDTSRYQSDPETSAVNKNNRLKKSKLEDKIKKIEISRLTNDHHRLQGNTDSMATGFKENADGVMERLDEGVQQEGISMKEKNDRTCTKQQSRIDGENPSSIPVKAANILESDYNGSVSDNKVQNQIMDFDEDIAEKVDESNKLRSHGSPDAAELPINQAPSTRRRNVGKRTGEKASKITKSKPPTDESPSSSKVTVAHLNNDSHINEQKNLDFESKICMAEQYFQCYVQLMKGLIAEECPVNYVKYTDSHHSPSQYHRFRTANTMFSKVKKASSKLIRLEHDLRAIKTQLGTYRESHESSSSSDDESTEGHPKRVIKGVANLTETFISAEAVESKSDVQEPAADQTKNTKPVTHLADDRDEDEKLKINPKVMVKKLLDEELLMNTGKNLTSDGERSCSILDSDSSKHHRNSAESSVTELSDNEISLKLPSKRNTKSKSIPKKVGDKKKTKPSKKGKSYEQDESDYEIDEDSGSESEFSTGMETGDEDIVHFGNNDLDDNTIAKNLLLQRMQNNNRDSDESDVDKLIEEGNDRTREEETKDTSKPDASRTASTRSSDHPLLKRNWKDRTGNENQEVGEPDNSKEAGKTEKRKRSSDKDDDEIAAKRRSIFVNSEQCNSDPDLTSDSGDDISKQTRSRVSRSKKRMVVSDTDSGDANVAADTQSKNDLDEDSTDDDNLDTHKHRNKRHRFLVKSEPIDETKATKMDIQEESPRKGGRKNIRKVMDDNEVSQSTQEAKAEELQRRKRLEAEREAEKETEDVIFVDEVTNTEISKTVTVRLILSKNPPVEVHSELVKCLKPHQVQGVQFIWDNLIEKVKVANSMSGTGCILSHCMGLGKTLQAVAFLHTVLLCDVLPKLRSTLILCPLGTVNNWKQEFQKWLPKRKSFSGASDRRLWVSDLHSVKNDGERICALREWKERGGVLIMGYGLFRSMLNKKKNRRTAVEREILEESMVNPGPDILVCDEGHLLKNSNSAIANCVTKVNTKRRLILTGTPLQNNMVEYHCMVSVVKPKLLGSIKEFKNRFVNPIENGQHVDSTSRDVKLMKKRAHVLHELLSGCVQRKDYACLREHLSPKDEYTLKVRLSDLQIRLYEKYLSLRGTADLKKNRACLFKDFNNLLLLVCHPRCLVMSKERQDDKTNGVEDEGSLESSGNESSSDGSVILVSDDDGDENDQHSPSIPNPKSLEDIHALPRWKLRLFIQSKSGKQPKTKNRSKLVKLAARYLDENFCKTREFEESLSKKSVVELKSMIKEHGGNFIGCKEKQELINLLKSLVRDEAKKEYEWYEKLMPSQEKLYFANEHGGKIVLMLEILRGAAELGDKVVVFSQSLLTLDLIELALKSETKDITNGLKSSRAKFSKWIKNKDYYRLDGSTPGHLRTSWISNFNDPRNARARLFIISTRAGGIGINLVGANRAIIFDVSWNPSHDIQSIFRIYRFGQEKRCYVYRLVAQGTMEEKVYERQVVKRSLSFRVVDEQQILRHFSAADIAELYTFKPVRSTGKKKSVPSSAPPGDALLASIINSSDLVVSFHEPDSLLGHQVAEELTEAERKAAWEEYDKENTAEKTVSDSVIQFFKTMDFNTLRNMYKKGEDLLKSIEAKITSIKDKSLSDVATEMRLKDRTVSTEYVMQTAIQQKLTNHVTLRRLLILKRVLLKHKTMALKTCQERFGHAYPGLGNAGAPPSTTTGARMPFSTPSSSSYSTATSTPQHPGFFQYQARQPHPRGGFRPNRPYYRRPRAPGYAQQAPSAGTFRHQAPNRFNTRMSYTARPRSK